MSSGTAVRPLELADLDAAIRLVGPELGELGPCAEDLRRNLFEDPDASRGDSVGFFEGPELAGIASAVLRPGGAHLKLLVVDPRRRRNGIGATLLRQVDQRLFSRGARSIQVDGAAPVYLLPGLPVRCVEGRRFLEARGYREGEARRSMTASLRDAELGVGALEDRLALAGFSFRRAAAAHAEELCRSVERLHSSEWAEELRHSMRRARPGVHVALSGGSIVGFAAAQIWSGRSFGPMATFPGHEGKGIGEVLLKRCLADVRASGEETVLIPWVGPVEFYRAKVGAELTLHYTSHTKLGSAPLFKS